MTAASDRRGTTLSTMPRWMASLAYRRRCQQIGAMRASIRQPTARPISPVTGPRSPIFAFVTTADTIAIVMITVSQRSHVVAICDGYCPGLERNCDRS